MKRPVLLIFALLSILAATFAGYSYVLGETETPVNETETTTTTEPATTDPAEDIDALNKEIEARKEKIKELEKTIDVYKNSINQKRTEAASLKNQLGILDSRIAQIQTDVELTQQKIKTAELEIEALGLTIAEKQKTITKQKQIVSQMVQNIHSGEQKNYLEIMLTYDNFADFYNELKYTENIYIDLGRSVKTLRIAKEELNGKKNQVENRRKAYADLEKELEEKKTNLQDQLGLKENLLFETQASETKYQTLLASVKEQYQAIENEVRAYEEKVRKKLEEQDKIKEDAEVLLSWPAPSHYVTAYFHDPNYPFKKQFEHSGIDIRASQGTAVKAAASGYIGRARRCSSPSCYSYVLIVHNGNISTLYGHLSKVLIAEDEYVNRGDIIGYSGGTPGTNGAGPFVTGAHLHFEVRLNGLPVNPLGYLSQ